MFTQGVRRRHNRPATVDKTVDAMDLAKFVLNDIDQMIEFEEFNALVGLPKIREAEQKYYAHFEDAHLRGCITSHVDR